MSAETHKATILAFDAQLDEGLRFLRLVWRVDHALQSISRRMEARYGVSGPQRLVLRVVGRFPGITAGDVALLLHTHPSTLTALSRSLMRKGLLERRPDPDDRRRAMLQLTRKGRVLDDVRRGTVEAAARRAIRRLEPGVLKDGQELLVQLAEEFDAEGGEAPERGKAPMRGRSRRAAAIARSKA